jgi:outer membrane protein OmpA-like peptidoglycan-associated protein
MDTSLTNKPTDDAKVQPAVTPPPTPAPAADKPATKPAPVAAGSGTGLTITFKSTETALPLSMKPELDGIAAKLKADDSLRLTLIGYASGLPEQASASRRVALARVLSVRAYLIDQGVSNLRMNVQAEGNKNPGGEPDRVDIIPRSGDEKK